MRGKPFMSLWIASKQALLTMTKQRTSLRVKESNPEIRGVTYATLISLFFHGVLAALLTPSFFKVSPKAPASFEVAWLMPSPSCQSSTSLCHHHASPCYPREGGDPEKSQQRKKLVTLKKTLPFLKNAPPSTQPLDPRLRGDDRRGRGNDKRGRGDDRRGGGDNTRGREDNIREQGDDIRRQERDKKGIPDGKFASDEKASHEPMHPKDLTHPCAHKVATRYRLHRPLPSYPWVCRKRGQEGVVCLHVKTNKEGQVVEVHLHKSSGHDLLDKAALEAVKSWVLCEGNSAKSLSIAFRLEGEAVSLS